MTSLKDSSALKGQSYTKLIEVSNYTELEGSFINTVGNFSQAVFETELGSNGAIIMDQQQYDNLTMYVLTNLSAPIALPVMSAIATEAAL